MFVETDLYPRLDPDLAAWEQAPAWLHAGTFLISDPHFYHFKIAEYCQRPAGWQELLIDNWNRLVGRGDDLLLLGDYCFWGQGGEALGRSLNGVKRLLLGNHDRGRSRAFFMRCGFVDVFASPYLLFRLPPYRLILSHYPCRFSPQAGFLNPHGHVHNSPYPFQGDPHYRNLSVEALDYRPVRLGELLGAGLVS